MGERWWRKYRPDADPTPVGGHTHGSSEERYRSALQSLFDGDADPSRSAGTDHPEEGGAPCHDG
jgi:hypothetical protein